MDVCRDDVNVADISEKLEKCLSVDTEDKMEVYHRLIQNGKDAAKQGEVKKALKFLQQAYDIHQSEKLESRIKKLEEHIAQLSDSEEEQEDFVDVNGSGLMLFKELHDKLYDYQRHGVAFLYSLYRDGHKGGILADDMGLGKTIQVISFLSGMYDNELAKHTLLVMPTSLITNWTKEFAKWTPGMRVKEFHGPTKERTRNLEKVQRRSGVIITTYTMLLNNWQQLSSYHGREFTWDYMILDEAHKIKCTSTKTAKSAHAIPSKNRVLLTGTPVQNNLKEMWALFDFACHGTLLGTAKTFKSEYENPITRAREKDATPGEKALGSRMSENLMAIINPCFLRRTKAEVQKSKMNGTRPCKGEYSDNEDGQVPNPPKDSGAVMPTLTRKNDLIVWTYLSSVQEDIYRQFISLDHIKELLMTTRSPLAELNIMKKLCDHPRLLSAAAIAKLGLEENQQNDDMEADTGSTANVSDDTLISESGKLIFLFQLLERLRKEGHRILVFAHYRKVLDIIERILGNRGFKVLRMDGTITQIAEREKLITRFQTDKRYSVFLLTTQVGGVGITLTAANRVVIYDPSWNPATDAQAVDRAYRIGQTENVIIYRLITCGTVEEKIYRRQVFKDSLIRQNTGDKKNPFRYFSKQELKELFILEDTRSSSTQLQLQALHSKHRRTDPVLDEHIAHLHAMEMFGISDHDLMFSLDVNHDEAEDQESHHYIEGRVQKAQELMKAESELQMQLTESMASSTEPAWLRQPLAENNRERSHEKKTRNPRPSPSVLQNDYNFHGSPVVELDKSGSDKENSQQNLSGQVIDLTADESMSEEQPVVDVSRDKLAKQNLYVPEHPPIKQERSQLEEEDADPQEVFEESLVVSETSDPAVGDMADVSVQDLMDKSAMEDQEEHHFIEGRVQEIHKLMKPELQMQRAEIMASSTEPAWPSGALDQSGSGEEDGQQKPSDQLVDLSADESMSEDVEVSQDKLAKQILYSPTHQSVKQERSHVEEEEDSSPPEVIEESLVMLETSDSAAGDMADASLQDKSALSEVAVASAGDGSLAHITAVDKDVPLKNKRLSVLKLDWNACKADTSPKVSTELESFEGNFNLQLEDSDMFSDHDVLDHQETEEEEKMLLSQLQMDGSFDIEKSLSERQHKEALSQSLNNVHNSEMDESMDDYIVATKKKRAAVIYDSDDDDQRELSNSFQVLGASTPKSGPTPLRTRKSVGGNTSVASSRSLLQSIMEDIDQDMTEEDEECFESADDVCESEQEMSSNMEESCSNMEKSSSNMEESSSNMEESSSMPELASDERIDQCTSDSGVKTNGIKGIALTEEESFDSLVTRGKEFQSKGQLDDALEVFLRAIDIKPGDPEVQLMTIQLYRKLSQRT